MPAFDAAFELDANITTHFDQRQAQAEADRLAALVNERLQKALKPVLVKIDAAQASQQLATVTKQHETLRKAVDQSTEAHNRFGDSLRNSLSKTTSLSGSTRNLIQNNQRYNASLKEIRQSTGAISALPKVFAQVEASVVRGNSALQQAAKSGNGLAQALVPILTLGTAVARDVDSIGFSLRALDKNTKLLVNALVPFEQRVPAAFKKSMEAVQEFDKRSNLEKARAGVSGLKEDLGEFKDFLAEPIFENAFKDGQTAVVSAITKIRDLFKRAFGKGSSIVEPTQLPLPGFGSTDSIKKKAGDVAQIAASEISKVLTAKIKGTGNIPLPGFDISALQPLVTKILAPGTGQAAFQKTAQEMAGAFQKGFESRLGTGKLVDALGLNTANVQAAASKAGTGFFKSFFAKFKDETGAKQVGFGGSIVTSAFKGIGKAAEVATSPVKALSKGLEGVASKLGVPEIAAAAAFAAAVVAIGKFSLQSAIRLETLNTALQGIFGTGAAKAFADINRFAAQTPFTVESAANAVIKLTSAFEGLSAKGALALLRPFSAAAAAIGATEDNVNRVVIALTQIQAAGRLTADNLRQITEALPNVSQTKIIENLAKDMGITQSAARDLLQNGLIPADVGIRAIAESADQAKGAQGALAKQSQTLTGLLSTLVDNLKLLAGTAFAPFVFVLKETVVEINIVIEFLFRALKAFIDLGTHLPVVGGEFRKLKPQIDAVVSGLGNTGAAADKAIPAIDAYTLAIQKMNDATTLGGKIKGIFDVQNAAIASANQQAKLQGEIIDKFLATKVAQDALSTANRAATQAQDALNEAVRKHNADLADKRIQLTDAVKVATDRLTEADNQLAEAEDQLAKARQGANPEELERADLSLAQAKLRLRQLIEDEKKATDELNKSQVQSVDLTGMSLDQIKSRLSLVRLNLKSQKEVTKAAADKSVEQKQIDALTATIDRRQAELDIVDAEKAVHDLKLKGSNLDEAVVTATKAVASATKERDTALKAQQKSQSDLNDLTKTDLDFVKQIKDLTETRNDATQKIKDAERDMAIARATALGDQKQINVLKAQELITTGAIFDTIKSASGATLASAKAQVSQILPVLLSGAKGIINGIPINLNADMIKNISDQLLNDPGSDIRLILHRILQSLGITVPGFKEGAIVGSETFARIGEAGLEAVLPLTRPARLEALLADQRVLNPVLASLQRITLPGPTVPGLTPGLPAPGLGPRFAPGVSNMDEYRSRKDREALASAIAKATVAEMVAAGLGSGTDVGGIHVTVPADNHESLIARAVAREIKKQLGDI